MQMSGLGYLRTSLSQTFCGVEPGAVCLQKSSIQQSHRCHTHDAAASLAVVMRLFIVQEALTGIQAGRARSALISQLREVAQPGVAEVFVVGKLLPLSCLRIVPVDVGAVHIILRIASDATHIAPCQPSEHATCREERHLGVIAHQSLAMTVEVKLRDTLLAIAQEDGLSAHKLHGIA